MRFENSFDSRRTLLIFGSNIRRGREHKGLSIYELSQMSNYSRNTLSNVEYGEQNIRYDRAVNLARVLNISFPQLFFMRDSEEGNISQTVDNGVFQEDNYLLVFIENFQRQLRMSGVIQADIYVQTGVSAATLSRIINGRRSNPTIRTLSAMAYIANDEMSHLFLRNNGEEDNA